MYSMASPPLAALCVSDVSQKCMGKNGLRKELCDNFWGFEAANCPAAARAAHSSCLNSVQHLEKGTDVCKWGEMALAPGVQTLAAYIKDPALNAEFAQYWPSTCQELQTKFSQNFGDGEKLCTEIENDIVKMVAKRV